MAYKIKNWMERYARENKCVIKDWQQVGPDRFDLWVIPAKDYAIWGDFAERVEVSERVKF